MDEGKVINLKPGEYRSHDGRLVEPFPCRGRPISSMRRTFSLLCATMLFLLGGYVLRLRLAAEPEFVDAIFNFGGILGFNLMVIGAIWFIADLRRHV